jgi:site-specific DNA recombinase
MDIGKQTLRAAFYIRVSTEDQADMNGRELQLAGLTALVTSKGVLSNNTPVISQPNSDHIYIDEVSGTTPLSDRPSFHRLMEDIENTPANTKPFDIVLVYKLDRFARRLSLLLETIDFFEKYGIQFISAHESIDTSTPFGKAILGITGVIAELELATIRERTHAGREEAIKKGELMVKKYGLWRDENKKVIVIKEEAEIIKRIFDMFVYQKFPKQRIANILKENHIATPNYSKAGKPRNTGKSKNPIWFWNTNEISRILKDEIYVGDYYYNKTNKRKALPKSQWKKSPVKLPQIIDDITFKKAEDQLQNDIHKNRITSHHQYLLSGLLRCDTCYDPKFDSKRVTWNGISHKYGNGTSYYYQCRRVSVTKAAHTCLALPLPAKELEDYVVDYVLDLIKNPKPVIKYQQGLVSSQLAEKELRKSEDTLIQLINSIPVMKDRLKEQHLVSAITTEDLTGRLSSLDKELIDNDKKLIAVRKQLSENHITETYTGALELFGKKYNDRIGILRKFRLEPEESGKTDPIGILGKFGLKPDENGKAYSIEILKKELYDLIHVLVEEIVVYTRDATVTDRIAGKKKSNQQVPFKLEIKLRLPQDFLEDLFEEQDKKYNEELLVKNHTW